jgi:hypothetical protein
MMGRGKPKYFEKSTQNHIIHHKFRNYDRQSGLIVPDTDEPLIRVYLGAISFSPPTEIALNQNTRGP